MATIRDITTMCKAGQVQEAYETAKTDLQANPKDVWTQREIGWSLYYLIKEDIERPNFQNLMAHLEELKSLDQLTIVNDSIIFDNVVFKLGEYVKNHIALKDIESPAKLSAIFNWLKVYQFSPSRRYSFLLQRFLKFDTWPELANFFDWWNLDNLTQEDYTPFVMDNGKKIMTLAERAYVANSKALLRLNDLGRIEDFLPKLDELMTAHTEMMYPGYFYGKLLLTLGSDKEEALKVIVPFARKKASEFWVWQLLSDAYTNEPDTQLACLLRAVHCRTQESFLGKVRIKLASFYVQRNQLDKGRFHIDAVIRCYASHGWKLPYEIDCWIHQPWLNTILPNGNDELDYMSITDNILCNGAEQTVAIVADIDQNSHKATLIYDYKKRMMQKLRTRVNAGMVLKINYVEDQEGHPKVINSTRTNLPADLTYAKYVEGVVNKRADKNFAFLKCGFKDYFISPNVVLHFNVQNGEQVKCLAIYNYNRRNDNWDWTCVTIIRRK